MTMKLQNQNRFVKIDIVQEYNPNLTIEFIENHPGIIRAAKTFGEYDIFMYIISKDSRDFHNLVKEMKKAFLIHSMLLKLTIQDMVTNVYHLQKAEINVFRLSWLEQWFF